MKSRENFVRAELEPIQVDNAKALLKTKEGVASAAALVLAIADCMDYALRGNEGFITIGIKRDRTSLLLTQTFGSEKVYHAGESLGAVLKHVLDEYANDL